jgi:hypothetical protein
MRRIRFVFFIVLLIITSNLYSQKKFEVGLYAGTSITSLSGVEFLADAMSDALTQTAGLEFPISESSRNFIFNMGGYVAYNVLPWLSLRGGIEYAPKGELFSGEVYLSTNITTLASEVLTENTILKLAYVEFPVSLQLSTRSKEKPRNVYFYVNMGVSPATKVVSKLDMTVSLVERGFNNSGVTSEVLNTENQVEDLDGIISSDLGLFGSVGVVFNSIFIDLKYNQGTKNILENTTEGNIKNTLYSLCLGFTF